MPKHGKKYRTASAKVDPTKLYAPEATPRSTGATPITAAVTRVVLTPRTCPATTTAVASTAGEAVNTAARVQSVAQPRQVLADGATQRLAGSGLGFADAGEHRL